MLDQIGTWQYAATFSDGAPGISGTFAAVLHPAVPQITLRHALASYAAVAEAERYRWPLSAFVPAALRSFDLPD